MENKIVMVIGGGILYPCLVSPQDYENVIKHSWSLDGSGYPQTQIDGKLVRLHRFILGLIDPTIYCDHIDRDILNCTRENLRVATPSQNAMNRRKLSGTSSQYKGVSYHKKNKKWTAYIKKDGKRKYLGSFTSEYEAHLAYEKAASELFGQYKLGSVSNG